MSNEARIRKILHNFTTFWHYEPDCVRIERYEGWDEGPKYRLYIVSGNVEYMYKGHSLRGAIKAAYKDSKCLR